MSPIDPASVSDADDEKDDPLFLNLGNHPEIANAVFPQVDHILYGAHIRENIKCVLKQESGRAKKKANRRNARKKTASIYGPRQTT